MLVSFGALIQVITTCDSGWLFGLCFGIGVVTRLEIGAILLLLRRWTNDVPTACHALRLRRGLPIKRHKWFNG